MSAQHLVPLHVEENGRLREATAQEYSEYEKRGGPALARWKTANRIAFAKQLISQGTDRSVAWAKAFDQYPDGNTKPRFIFKK